MRELRVTLETVTPLFLGGADQQPELRPPSIRGQLRYWLRAALGGVIGDQNLDGVKKAESEVFGSTNGTGAIRIRTGWLVEPETVSLNPLPHKPSPTRFDGFIANQKFDLTVTQRQGTLATWLAAVGAMLLMIAFGGLGRRSRRGWGTLQIVHAQVQQADLPSNWVSLLKFNPRSAADWQAYLLNTHKAAMAASRSLSKELGIECQRISQPAEYPVLDTANPGRVCKTTYSDAVDAIREFGEREHRFGVTKAFGSATDPRWASPLWVRVFPVSQPKRGYVLALTLIESKSNVADYAKLHRFISEWDVLQPEAKA